MSLRTHPKPPVKILSRRVLRTMWKALPKEHGRRVISFRKFMKQLEKQRAGL